MRRGPRAARRAARRPDGSARRSRELAGAHHQRDQRGRRRDADQSRGDGPAGDAAPGAGRGRSRAAGGAVSAVCCATRLTAPLVTVTAQSGAEMIPLRRIHGHARAAAAPARRHHAHDRRARRAGDLLPQQHSASVRHALAARLLLSSATRACAPSTSSAWSGASIPISRPSLRCAGRGGDRRRRSDAARGHGALESAATATRTGSEWQRPPPDLARGLCSCRCSPRRRFKPSSGTTWWSRCCCRRAPAPSPRRRSSSAAISMAQRMSVLYGLNSPEFFDKSLFRNFIELLRRRNVIAAGGGRHHQLRRAAARRRRGRAARAVRADAARHPAGDARSAPERQALPSASAPASPTRGRCAGAWCRRGASSDSMRRSFEARVGRVFLRILGSISAARIRLARRSSAARRFCSWLRSLGGEQDAAVVDELLAGEPAQPRLRTAPAGWRSAAAGSAAARRSPPC